MRSTRLISIRVIGSVAALLIPVLGVPRSASGSFMSVKESAFFPICSHDTPTQCIEGMSISGVPLLPARVLSNTELRFKDSQGRDSGIVYGDNRRPYWRCAEGWFESPGGRACGVGDYPNFLLHPEDVNLNFPLGPGGRNQLDYGTEEGRSAARADVPSSYPPAYVGVQVFAAPIFRHSENGFNLVIGSYGFHFDVFNERGIQMTTKENDEFTFRINFGFVPAPNFFANSNVSKYDVSVDEAGATVVEMTLRPVVGAAPPNVRGQCAGLVGGPRTLFFNTGRFSWGNSSIDVETGTELPFAGNAVTTNGPCADGMPDIRPDGTLNVVLGAPHLYADGSLNKGEFTVILSRATMFVFGFGVDRILLGGLKMGIQTASKVEKLDYQATIADNGAVVIHASNFHYSTPTLSIKKSSFKTPPLKEKLNVSASSKAHSGKPFDLIVNSSIANASVFVTGSRGGPQFIRTLKGVPAQSRLSITIPRSVPTGRGSLVVWYPGDRNSRNTSTEIPIRIDR